MFTLLFFAACAGQTYAPELWVQTDVTPIDSRAEALHGDADSGVGQNIDTSPPPVAPCVGAAVADGSTLYIAWILPSRVPDPTSGEVTLSLATACGTTTSTAMFASGTARWVVAAPAGSTAGLQVQVTGYDLGATCSLPATVAAVADCPTSDSGGTDSGTGGGSETGGDTGSSGGAGGGADTAGTGGAGGGNDSDTQG